ncbi:MAG: shikimate dehydrogenase [Legionellales bacterium]|nr:shikimate dehydrogenase [Legionellales bacterium]
MSPKIHSLFAKQMGISLEYQAIEVPLDKLGPYVTLFSSEGGKGLNITIPFKENAYLLCTDLTKRAKESGSVNTIKFDEKTKIIGDTTDGQGLLNDLIKNYNISLKEKTILILGAGGTVRSIIQRLISEEIKEIVIVNRTVSRAKDLEKKFNNKINIKAYSYEALPRHAFNLIINATSLSLSSKIPLVSKEIINKNTFCYDLMYSNNETIFTKWAIENGAMRAVDGLGMLVEQAAESFFIWHGVKPDTAKVISALKNY